jgi:hypothetical protein
MKNRGALDRAPHRRVQTEERSEQRRLSGAVAADDTQDLAPSHIEVDGRQDCVPSEADRKPACQQQNFAALIRKAP